MLPADIELISTLRTRLAFENETQETQKVTAKDKTAARNAAHQRIEDAIGRIQAAAELAFLDKPERLERYRTLIPSKSSAKNPHSPRSLAALGNGGLIVEDFPPFPNPQSPFPREVVRHDELVALVIGLLDRGHTVGTFDAILVEENLHHLLEWIGKGSDLIECSSLPILKSTTKKAIRLAPQSSQRGPTGVMNRMEPKPSPSPEASSSRLHFSGFD